MLYISGLRRLEKPSLDLNITRTSPQLSLVYHVAALPGGQAVINHIVWNNKTRQVLRLDSEGRVTQVLHSCVGCAITGLLVLDEHLYIIYYNGPVIETRVSDGHVLSTSTIPDVRHVVHTGSLYSKPDKIPDKQTLLLCDYLKDEVFTFKPLTGQKQVRVTGLDGPTSVSYFFHNYTVYYLVCDGSGPSINVYNQTWHLIRTIGTEGSDDGELHNPISAIVSDEDTIIISEWRNHRISEFSFNGTFLRHLLVRSDGIIWPYSMSYYYPHLWLVIDDPSKLYRYSLYG